MAEERYTEWKAPITSWELRHALIGVLEPGRYRGFDTMVSNGAPGAGVIPIKITHATTGLQKTQFDNTLTANLFSMLLTRQGVIIHTDDMPELDIDDNAGNASIRYDYLIAEYEWVQSVGGQVMSVSILKGPLNNPILPTLTNPEKTIILGTFTLLSNAGDTSDITYLGAYIPGLGNANILTNNPILDSTYARLAAANTFQNTNSEKYGGTVTCNSGFAIIGTLGNAFEVDCGGGVLGFIFKGFKISPSVNIPIGTCISFTFTNLPTVGTTLFDANILGQGSVLIINADDNYVLRCITELGGLSYYWLEGQSGILARRSLAVEGDVIVAQNDISLLQFYVTTLQGYVQDDWVPYSFDLSELAVIGGVGSLVINSQKNNYKVMGKTLFLNFNVNLTLSGGDVTSTGIKMTIPDSMVIDNVNDWSSVFCRLNVDGLQFVGGMVFVASNTSLYIQKIDLSQFSDGQVSYSGQMVLNLV